MTRRLRCARMGLSGLILDSDRLRRREWGGRMAEQVRARRLSDEEGRRLQQIVRRGKHESVRVRRALIIMASGSGTPVPAIARLVAAHEDTVRDVIHRFNEVGLRALDPNWAGGRPRRISPDDETYIIETAKTRPKQLGRPFTQWSIRKLADYLATNKVRRVHLGRERLRQLLRRNDITFQRTRTWKESTDPDKDAKLDRIEEVTSKFPGRCFAFDQFGPLSIRPCHGCCWAPRTRPVRLPATYHRTHGIRYFHGCYSLADDQLWGVMRRKGGDHSLAAFQSIRATRPDGAPIYIICDNLSANTTPAIRAWAARNNVELCLTPTSASWANPIEAQFGPLRSFTMANSNYPNHTVLAREMQAYLRWRNANARHPDVLAAQRRERARVRSERQHRWGRPRAA
ncbi:MAG TPA: IS630 family transposase [Mycobacterium sp.]|nr:IS630 family transposase [Mycobacterium sp.]